MRVTVKFTVTQDELKAICDSLESAASACETMAEESSSNDMSDAAKSWEHDVENLDTLRLLIRPDGRMPWPADGGDQ
jgi:hypothetical protein